MTIFLLYQKEFEKKYGTEIDHYVYISQIYTPFCHFVSLGYLFVKIK